jgi:hypothetical protein
MCEVSYAVWAVRCVVQLTRGMKCVAVTDTKSFAVVVSSVGIRCCRRE